MAAKRYSDWVHEKDKNMGAVLALGGTERARIDEAVAFIRSVVLTQAADFNHDRFNGSNADLSDIISAAKTLPMMADKRLVEVRQVEALKGDLDELFAYTAQKASFSSVLLLVFEQSPDLRHKLAKHLAQNGQLYIFDAPKEYEMPAVIDEYLKRYGFKCSAEAHALLTVAVGTDLALLESMLKKLSIALASKQISAADIETHIKHEQVDAFSFGRSVASGDINRALSMLCQLRAAQEVPLKIVGLLAWQLRQIVKCRALLDEGNSEFAVEKQLNLFGKNKELIQVAKRATLTWHAQRLARLSSLDYDLKSQPGSPWLHFEKYIIELVNLKPL